MAGNGYHWRQPRPRPAPPALPWEWATNYYQRNLELSRILPQHHHCPYYIKNRILAASNQLVMKMVKDEVLIKLNHIINCSMMRLLMKMNLWENFRHYYA